MKHQSGFLDLDVAASRREAQGTPVQFKVRNETYSLPVELPLDTIDLLLSDEVGLVEFAKKVMATSDDVSDGIVKVLLSGGNVPKALMDAAYAVMMSLLGEEQYKKWRDGRPSLIEFGKILGYLFTAYGVSLGEAFVSLTSSIDAGATSKQTSPDSTESTPEPSGEPQDSPADSSGSGD